MTLDEKIAATQEELKNGQQQIEAWKDRFQQAVGRLAALQELQAEQAPPKEE